jgi:hypothetical protein
MPVIPPRITRVDYVLSVLTKGSRERGKRDEKRKDRTSEMMMKWLTLCCHGYPKHSLMRLDCNDARDD